MGLYGWEIYIRLRLYYAGQGNVNGMSLPNESAPSTHIPIKQSDITKMPKFNRYG